MAPDGYLSVEAARKLNGVAGPVLLPTWVPEWVRNGASIVIVEEVTGTYVAKWDVEYPTDPRTIELDSSLSLGLFSEVRTADEPAMSSTTERRTTSVRTYVLGDSYSRGVCGGAEGPDGVGATWDEGPRRFTVLMTPTPGCAEGFTIEDARAFADSVVTCIRGTEVLRCPSE